MVIGIPKEIKDNEGRVSLTPKYVQALVVAGHTVRVERGAGVKSRFADNDYLESGALLVSAFEAWSTDLVVKVKEPLPEEYPYFQKGLTVFTFFHFAGNPELKRVCEQSQIRAVPYESIFAPDSNRPILRAMSRIAGEVAYSIGGGYVQKYCGIILSHATVTIIGAAGSAGRRVHELLIDENARTKRVKKVFPIDIVAGYSQSNPSNIEHSIIESDLVIGAAVNKSAGAPKLITRQMVQKWGSAKPDSILIDISIDEGGISETSRPTSHTSPTYTDEGIIHYCVPNIPGIVPRSSTIALSNASFPYILELANTEKIER